MAAIATNIQNTPSPTTRKPYFRYMAILVLFVAFTACAIAIPSFRFTEGMQGLYSLPLFFSLTFGSFFIGAVCIIIGIRIFGAKINVFYLTIFGLMIIGGIIGTYSHDTPYAFRKLVLEDPDREWATLGMFVTILTSFGLFVFFNFFPYSQKNRCSTVILLEILILLGIVMIVYSLITEFDKYVYALEKGVLKMQITSFTPQKNVFGNYLLLSFCAEMALLNMGKRQWRYLPAIVFVVFLLFLGDKADSVISLITLLGYATASLIYSLIVKPRRLFAILVPAIILVCFLVAGVAIYFMKPTLIESILHSFEVFFSDRPNTSTAQNRMEIWSNSLSLNLRGAVYWIFGHGDTVYPALMSEALFENAYGQAHNAYLEMLGRGGIVRLVVFVALIVYLVILIHKAGKKRFLEIVLFCLLGLGLLARSVIESYFLLDFTADTIGYLIVLLLPWLVCAKGEEAFVPATIAKPTLNLDGCLRVFQIVLGVACLFFIAFFPHSLASLFAGAGIAISLFVFLRRPNQAITTAMVIVGLLCGYCLRVNLSDGGYFMAMVIVAPLFVSFGLGVLLESLVAPEKMGQKGSEIFFENLLSRI